MELSIIVPVYNMAADGKLEYCLNSLLQQTISDFEIIAVDAASTDQSPQILLEYAAHYPDVFQVHFLTGSQGEGSARNVGLKAARGRWIGFVNGDDWIAPAMYEKLLKKANTSGADMVACNYHVTCEHSAGSGQEIRTHDAVQTGVLDEEKRRLLLLDPGSFTTKIYKRRLMNDCSVEFSEYMSGEDIAISCAIIMRARHFEYVNEPLYYSYGCEGSAMDTVNTENLQQRMEDARIMVKHAEANGYLEQYHDEIAYKFTELFYVNTLLDYLQGKGRKDRDFLRAMQQEMVATFPDFLQNPYYRQRIGEEKRALATMLQRSIRRVLVWHEWKMLVHGLKEKGLKALLPGLGAFAGMIAGGLLCLGIAAAACKDQRTLEYPVVLLGDSIIANDYVGAELDEMLAEGLGEEVFNGGFGGSYLCNQNLNLDETGGDESLSMEELANSIISGDFLAQKSAIKRASRLDYYESRLETLSQIDFEKTHTLIIEHCVNDYALQIPPEQVRATLREVIQKLQDKYPDMHIWISSPTYCYIVVDGENLYCDTTDLGPYTLEEYILAEEQVCEELGVGFVNNYHQDVITKETMDRYYLDGLHLNEAGRQVIANNILAAMDQGYPGQRPRKGSN